MEEILNDNIDDSKSGRYNFTHWMAVAALVIVLDQITKRAILKWVELHDSIEISSWFYLTHRENPGAAWSFLANESGWQRWFLSALAIGVSAYLVVWLWRLRRERSIVLSVGLALVLGGALGNVIDRILLGHVIDFIQVWIGSWEFPAFNIADSAISVGAGCLIVDALFLTKLGEASSTPDNRSM